MNCCLDGIIQNILLFQVDVHGDAIEEKFIKTDEWAFLKKLSDSSQNTVSNSN